MVVLSPPHLVTVSKNEIVMETTMISITDLHKAYQMGDVTVHALQGVSFSIERGEFVAIIGPSGSGKSTLMNMIGCLDTPSSGSYQLDGEEASALTGSPSVILADEPTGALDSKTSAEIMNILQRLNREQGLTVVLVTHEADIAAYARRVLTMCDGVVVSDMRN